jgi:hypothetical protein
MIPTFGDLQMLRDEGKRARSTEPFLVLFAAVCMLACGSSTSPRHGSGSYVLVTIDGHTLPYVRSGPVVVSSSLQLNSNGTAAYTEVDSFPPGPSSTNQINQVTGSWTLLVGDSLRVTGTHNGASVTLFGRVNAIGLTLYQQSAGTWVYDRE